MEITDRFEQFIDTPGGGIRDLKMHVQELKQKVLI